MSKPAVLAQTDRRSRLRRRHARPHPPQRTGSISPAIACALTRQQGIHLRMQKNRRQRGPEPRATSCRNNRGHHIEMPGRKVDTCSVLSNKHADCERMR
jgi:hypothetical protein